MKKLAYVAHPYSNNPVNNCRRVNQLIKAIRAQNYGLTIISPLHSFGYQGLDYTYEQTMEDCLSLLSKCEIAIFPDYYKESKGCLQEMEFCKKNLIPIVIHKTQKGENNNGN